MRGSELSLLWEKLCCIIIFQLRVTFPVDVGFGDGGVWVQWPRHAPRRVGAAVGPCSVSPILCSLTQNGLGYSRNITVPD